MIEVVMGEVARADTEAVLRPVGSDWSPVTPAMRRLESAAGPAVLDRCRRLGELPVGSAVITPAGDLPVDFLVHVVVRSYDQPVSGPIVSRALLNGLRRLEEWAMTSVAMPALGTGAGNLDAEAAADAMLPVLLEFLRSAKSLARVVLVMESDYEREAFERRLETHRRDLDAGGVDELAPPEAGAGSGPTPDEP